MSNNNWNMLSTGAEVGDVTILHHSTSSTIQVVVWNDAEQVKDKPDQDILWLSYKQFSDLIAAIEKIRDYE